MTLVAYDGLNIVSRSGWGALAPIDAIPLNTPVKYVRIDINGKEPCRSLYECTSRCQKLQIAAMEGFDLDDIPFNFLIGADGRIYEGRGWQTEPYRPRELDCLTGLGIEIAYLGGNYTKKVVDGMQLPGKEWTVLDRFCTDVGRSNSRKAKWGQAFDQSCDCGVDIQAMHHIVEDCALRAFPAGVSGRKPPASSIKAVELLLQYGVSAGFIKVDYVKTNYFERLKFDINDAKHMIYSYGYY